MKKTAIVITVIVSVAAVACIYLWGAQHRYYGMNVGTGWAYLVDRQTGDVWRVYYDYMHPVERITAAEANRRQTETLKALNRAVQ